MFYLDAAVYQRPRQSTSKQFDDNIAKMRSNTSGTSPPTYSPVRPDTLQRRFLPLTTDDVISAVRRPPDKSSAVDPIQTSVLKQIIDLVAPFIAELFNRSPSAGHCPAIFNKVFITTIVK